jgi:hypothetical protein
MDDKPQAGAAGTKQEPAAQAEPAQVAHTAAQKPGRHDAAYLADQAEQRRAGTRFDSKRFRRKQEADNAPRAR